MQTVQKADNMSWPEWPFAFIFQESNILALENPGRKPQQSTLVKSAS